jgi:hypothetical protein
VWPDYDTQTSANDRTAVAGRSKRRIDSWLSGVGRPLNRISLLIVNIGDHARAFVLA